MIHSYLSDDVVRIRQTGDEENPTIFHVRPITGRAYSKWQALMGHAAKKIIDAMVDNTADRAMTISDKQTNQQIVFLAARVPKIENAFFKGEVREEIVGEDVNAFIDGMLTAQRDDLLASMLNDVKLQELSFRD